VNDQDELRRVWGALEADLGGQREAVRRVAALYLDELLPRVDKVSRALEAGDLETARTALYSIWTGSEMIGAARAARSAAAALRALETAGAAGPDRAELRSVARETWTLVATELEDDPGPGQLPRSNR